MQLDSCDCMMSKEHEHEGLFERIREKHEEHKEERETEHELAKDEPNKSQRRIDKLNKETDEFNNEVAFASEDILNEET